MMKFSEQIKHSVSWRWRNLVGFVRPHLAHWRVMWRWNTRGRGIPHRLPVPLVVSVTSYPPRFGTLDRTLKSLLRQTMKADHTILWIAHGDLPLLPKKVTDLQNAGLEIRTTEDTKSYKKILPALDAFPNAFITTADDDLYYWPHWLEQLVKGMELSQQIITCHRAHEIKIEDNGSYKAYKHWNRDIRKRGMSNQLFPTSGGGALYPPGSLAHNTDDRKAAFDLCPSADDIWLYWISRRNGNRYRAVGRWHNIVAWHGSQDEALWYENVMQGGNDDQLRKMAERYGYPDCR